MIEKDGQDELLTRYILRKYTEMLAKDSIFRQYAVPVCPLPRHKRIYRRVKRYLSNLWYALRGKEYDCGCTY